jgi:hypothetical protein
MRNTVKRATAGAALGGSLFFTAGLAIAFAQPDTANDDLVNLSLGSAGTLEDVNVTAAVEIAAAVCSGVAVPQTVTTTADTAANVDASGTEAVVCNNNLGAITISQNDPGQSEEAPGIAGETPTSPTTTTTTTTTTEEGG